MKKAVTLAVIILTVTLSVSLLESVNAQTYTPGVKVGDVFKYQYEFTADANGTSQVSLPTPFDALVEQAKTIDWIQMTITGVSGSTVTAQMLTQYKTGTQQSYTGTANVATGNGELAMFLIAANLTTNNPLRQGSSEIINGTTSKTYTSGVTRELNYEKIVTQYNVPANEVLRYNITVPLTQVNTQESLWDKQTGALAEMNFGMVTTSTQINATLSLSMKMVESNVFAVPEFPTLLVVLIVMIVPTFVVLKKRKKF